MTVIDLRNISFVRGEKKILNDISWSIVSGHHWALLGANGSGKTTLLKIITGYEWPTEGTVQVLGETFGECNLPKLRKKVGWVSSSLENDVPESDTAVEIVASGLEASFGLYREYNLDEFQKAKEALSLLGGDGFADLSYRKLSQGERQRVLIARALINQPMLLVLDEPCSGLDPSARELFLNDLARLARQKQCPTMILVTHHIEEIGAWIKHVLVIKSGKILRTGQTEEVLTDRILSQAFDRTCIVENHGDRYYLRLVN